MCKPRVHGELGHRPAMIGDVALGIDSMVGNATLSCMIMLARRPHSEWRQVAWYAVTLVITRYRPSLTHVGV